MNGEQCSRKTCWSFGQRKSQQDFGRCKVYVQQFAFYHCWQRVQARRTERTTVV